MARTSKVRKTRERVSIRSRKAIKYGEKIAKCRVGLTKRTFSIHEELLCSQSIYFRMKLQKGRKPIEGECPICHDTMDPTRSNISFCSSECGANMHYHCIKGWEKKKSARSEAATCPMWRQQWSEEDTEEAVMCHDLHTEAFDCYCEWLYHQHILLPSEDESEEDDRGIGRMIKAYELSRQVRDTTFGKAVLQTLCEIFQDTESYPSMKAVGSAYSSTSKGSQLRKLIVDAYVSQADPEWFDDSDDYEEGDYYPTDFLIDVTKALLSQRTDSRDPKGEIEKLKDKHCISEEEEEEESLM